MSGGRVPLSIAAVIVVTIFFLLSNDGRHHWHEFREIHSAQFYSNAELMNGAFDPGPSPLRTPDEVAAWYASKLLHITLLRLLIELFGVGLTALKIIQTVYAALLPATALLTMVALRNIGVSARRAGLVATAMLLSPLSIYLGFKSLGDLPALLFAAAAAGFFAMGLRRPARIGLLSAAGISVALSAMASWTGLPLFLGFCGALLVTPPNGLDRRSVAIAVLVGMLAAILGLAAGLALLDGSIGAYWSSLVALMGFSKALPMWLFALSNVGLFGGILWIFAPLSLLSNEVNIRRIFLVWLGIAVLLSATLAGGFLEPRYLIGALVPLAGLAVMGVEAALDHTPALGSSVRARIAWGVALSLTAVGSAAALRPIMPYELDQDDLSRIMRERVDSDSLAILVPWGYSDFHFLRFAYPDRPVYLVQSAATEAGEPVDDSAWTARFREMYGDRYLSSAAAVPQEFDESLLYVGWTVLPSLQNLKAILEVLGLHSLAGYVDASQFRNHMAESWVVSDPNFTMRELATYGQYHVFAVKHRQRVGSHSAIRLAPNAQTPDVPLWGVFETTLSNDRRYLNSFAETELDAVFQSPSGNSHPFFGFFDGDGKGGQHGTIWKLRFMCLEPGIWQWSATFSDGATGGSGAFRCTTSALAGPLRVNEDNRHWLKRADGRPFFPRWYYLHELLFSKEAVWQQDVDDLLVQHGYNMVAVLTTQAEHLIANGWNRRDYERPFFYPWKREGSVVDWDSMDLASWHKLDRVLRYLQERGIYVYFFDGFFPNIEPHFPSDPFKENAYLRYALARVGAYSNVTHNVGFEFSEFMSTSRLNRIGRYVKASDPFDLLLTVHDTQDFGEVVRREPWLDLANLQSRAGTAGSAEISNGLVAANYYEKPVAATELVWEGPDKLTAEQVRRGAWGIVLAGGFFLYGEFNLGGIGVGDFGSGKAHASLRVMFDFMESIPYWTMKPRNDLVDTGNYCLANSGTEYIVYTESGRRFTLNLSEATGRMVVNWINPRTGTRQSGPPATGGEQRTFTPPTEDDGPDWVLHVRDSKWYRARNVQ